MARIPALPPIGDEGAVRSALDGELQEQGETPGWVWRWPALLWTSSRGFKMLL